MIELKPGMRVRCVRPGLTGELQLGAKYLVEDVDTNGYVTLQFINRWWAVRRFKPVIRVKAGRSTAFSTTHVKSASRHGFSGGGRTLTEGPFRGMTQDDALDLVIGGY